MATNTLLDWMNAFSQKYGIAVSDAETVETVVEDDAALEAEYQQLGGDRALLKVLAADDHAFLARLDKQRAQARAAHQELLQDLDFQRHMLETQLGISEGTPPRIRTWHAREMQTYSRLSARIRSQGEKLNSEAGRQLLHLMAEPEQKLAYYGALAGHYDRWAAQARPNFELVQKRIADATETYEAIESRIRATRVELDNLLELDALSMTDRVRRLKNGGSDESRESARYAIEGELLDFVQASSEKLRGGTAHFDEEWAFEPNALDWKPIEKQLALVERTDLDQLQKRDPKLERLWDKYVDAGGDEALFTKRVAAWRTQMSYKERTDSVKSMQFRNEIGDMQGRLADAQLGLRATRKELAEIATRQRAKQARARELTAGAATGELLSGRESAELKLLARELKRLATDVTTRTELVRVHADSIANIQQRMERARELYEHEIEDDEQVQWEREPRSEDLRKLPLKVKYAELTKKQR